MHVLRGVMVELPGCDTARYAARKKRLVRSRGLAPMVAVETGTGQFDAWMKLADQPISSALLARLMPSFGEAAQYGRLAGFTNQQAEANTTGRQLFALLHNATGQVARAVKQYLADLYQKSRDRLNKQREQGAARRPNSRSRSR